MELKITKEKVLEAASKCSTAKRTLETLFPEVFETDELDFTKYKIDNTDGFAGIKNDKRYLIGVRAEGQYKNKAFLLTRKFNWEFKTHFEESGEETLLLIPTPKKP